MSSVLLIPIFQMRKMMLRDAWQLARSDTASGRARVNVSINFLKFILGQQGLHIIKGTKMKCHTQWMFTYVYTCKTNT